MLLTKKLDKILDGDHGHWKLCKVAVHCLHVRLGHQSHKRTHGGRNLRASAVWSDAHEGLFQDMQQTCVLMQQEVG